MDQNKKQKGGQHDNDREDEQIVIDLDALGEEERVFVENALIEEALYESVIAQLHISADTPVFHAFITGILKGQAKDRLIVEIWKNMDEKQLDHLNFQINSLTVTDPEKDKDALLIDFALMYPALMQKVYAGMKAFFDEFVEEYNKLHDA
ncbi:hypothetical protein HY604_02625 [Candidatus Peregrinibacteria bacterium]|nr:hypothetical protein [Candidatus Peregrinibacteria bacterium]